ncbi:MAG TPA: ABC transporter substrate-binding protein [Candidatus Binatus sp.]|nr:ABC transporter substrate-binding protein [Candidatus Binatus sp.]
MNRRRHRLALSHFIGLVILFSSTIAAFGAAAPVKYAVGYATFTARIVPLWLAQEQGFFAKYGIDVEPIFIRGAPTLVAGLAAGSIHIGRTGGSAMLAAVAAGHDFKVLAAFNTRNTYDLVVRPNIKRAEDLRGKTFAVTSIGGTSWMGVLLWLEHLGLDQQRDNIRFQVIGDQAVQVQCVENGLCDAAAVDGVFTKQLKQKGMTVLGEYTDLKSLLIGQSMVVPSALLQQRPEIAEAYLKGEIEALVFSLAPKNKPVVLKTLSRWLKIDASGAEDAYLDLVRGVDRKPFASLEGLRNAQRLLKTRNPKVGEVKAEDVIDGRLMRRLDDSGFIDKLYAFYGASQK